MFPTNGSLFAEMVAISDNIDLLTLRLWLFSFSTTLSVISTILRNTSVLLCSEPIISSPAFTNASVRTMAVVVPSPALVAVLSAASRIILTARFSTGSIRSIAFATVTPSFVTVIPCVWCGDSITTVLPPGPKVLLTAEAILLMPLISFWRPAWSKCKSFGLYPVWFHIPDV